MKFRVCVPLSLSAVVLASSASVASAASCGSGAGGFPAWLNGFQSRAAAQGVSAGTLSSALSGVTYDPKIISLDRNQHSFKLSFQQFYARRVSGGMIAQGRRLMGTHRATLNKIEQRFGVPAAVVVAIWALETSYGAQTGGKYSIVRSLATLSYDCRRSAFFEKHLIGALKIIDRGDMPISQLRGGWAGEIGQTQFLPDAYVTYAVDFDGNGRRDLIHSVPDVLASTANFLKGYGWQAGGGWGAGSHNYDVLRQWNSAEVYVRTIAAMAEQLGQR